ncbi:unnamed protein product [Clavelina lepadiformis]|uniref:Reverse transcriptase domain-containing protein n=2 Tax=Clavelina lepadiformis TaxID=159417 RepID=A0ABP0FK96_CLALP
MNAANNEKSAETKKAYEDAIAALGNNEITYSEYLDAKRNLRNQRKKETIEKTAKNRKFEGKLGSKAFFQKYKNKQKQTFISELYDENFLPTQNPKEMTKLAQSFYEQLYKKTETNENAQYAFLNETTRKLNTEDNKNLEKPITIEEIENAVKSMKNGKSPGPDGLSAELYKECWPLIRNEIRELIQYWFDQKVIPREIKKGIITLIHKKGDDADLKNYRPITLLNVEYKIYTKILTNRLKEIMPNLIGDSQFATVGKTISEGTTLLRDLFEQSSKRGLEAFLVSLDFEKAFDSIEKDWLKKTLCAINLSTKIRHIIENLYEDSTAEIMINGHRSAEITLDRGVRQGDPLSFFLFLIATEPLTEKLSKTQDIKGIQLSGRREIKNVSYADDVTLTLKNIASVEKALDLVEKFKPASGLKLNIKKTQGLIINGDPPTLLLPDIKWNKTTLNLLGTTIGIINLNHLWQETQKQVENKIEEIKKTYATLDAKEILIKSKLLAITNNAAQTYPPPVNRMRSINEKVKNYAVGKFPHVNIDTLQLPKLEGGLNLPNFEIYADLTYLKSIRKYCLARVLNEPLSAHNSYIEYQIGHVIPRTLEVVHLNNLPHTDIRSPYYEKVIEIIKKYDLKKIDLICGSLKKTYNRIISKPRTQSRNTQTERKRWERIHCPELPSYLRTFNFKLESNLLPFNTDINQYAPTTKNSCRFCRIGPDTAYHLFHKCPQTKIQWKKTITIAEKTLNLKINKENVEKLCALRHDMGLELNTDKVLTVLITTMNHQIWKTRLKCVIENQQFSSEKLSNDIYRSFKYRISTLRKNNPDIVRNLTTPL